MPLPFFHTNISSRSFPYLGIGHGVGASTGHYPNVLSLDFTGRSGLMRRTTYLVGMFGSLAKNSTEHTKHQDSTMNVHNGFRAFAFAFATSEHDGRAQFPNQSQYELLRSQNPILPGFQFQQQQSQCGRQSQCGEQSRCSVLPSPSLP